jgi:hypothetical protein
MSHHQEIHYNSYLYIYKLLKDIPNNNFNIQSEDLKKGGCLLKKLCWNCLKYVLLIVVVISSGFTIYLNYTGSSFDPIKEIQSLRNQNRRDDAMDLTKFYNDAQTEDQEEITRLQNDLEYTAIEKIKSISWDGFILGRVHDSYSGIGAISSDLCIYGDVRDLGVQGWKHLTKADDADAMVALLSAAGIGLSTTAFINGSNALAKNTLKYLKKVPESINTGLLKKFLSGKVSPAECKKIWQLLKKTNGPFPAQHPVSAMFIV